jgi:hypothetical protein
MVDSLRTDVCVYLPWNFFHSKAMFDFFSINDPSVALLTTMSKRTSDQSSRTVLCLALNRFKARIDAAWHREVDSNANELEDLC